MPQYFISKAGKVRQYGPKSRGVELFDLERFSIKNIFETRNSAHLMIHVLEERYPRIFYDERKKQASQKGK